MNKAIMVYPWSIHNPCWNKNIFSSFQPIGPIEWLWDYLLSVKTGRFFLFSFLNTSRELSVRVEYFYFLHSLLCHIEPTIRKSNVPDCSKALSSPNSNVRRNILMDFKQVYNLEECSICCTARLLSQSERRRIANWFFQIVPSQVTMLAHPFFCFLFAFFFFKNKPK